MASSSSTSGNTASVRVSTSVAGPIISENDFLPIIANNQVADLNPELYEERFHIMAEFLRSHYIQYALTAFEEVPLIFLQEFWASASFNKETQTVQATVDSNLEVNLTKNNLRWLLRLPRASKLPSGAYDELPTSAEILQTLKAVGYSEDIRLLSHFRRMKLPPVWNFLFSVVNRCLTGKKGGFDQGNFNVLSIFHGLVNNLNLDYTQLIWNDLHVTTEEGHKGRINFIPYPRFWGMCIKVVLGSSDTALSAERRQIPLQKMQLFKSNIPDSSFPKSSALSPGMLSHIPSESSILLRYRGSQGDSEPSSPIPEPTSMPISCEGSEERREVSEHISESKSEGSTPSESRATSKSASGSHKSGSVEIDSPRPLSYSVSPAYHSLPSQQGGVSEMGEPHHIDISSSPTDLHVYPDPLASTRDQEFEPISTVGSDPTFPLDTCTRPHVPVCVTGATGLNKHIYFPSESESEDEVDVARTGGDQSDRDDQGSQGKPEGATKTTTPESGHGGMSAMPTEAFVASGSLPSDLVTKSNLADFGTNIMLMLTELKDQLPSQHTSEASGAASEVSILKALERLQSEVRSQASELQTLKSTIQLRASASEESQYVTTSDFQNFQHSILEQLKGISAQLSSMPSASTPAPQVTVQGLSPSDSALLTTVKNAVVMLSAELNRFRLPSASSSDSAILKSILSKVEELQGELVSLTVRHTNYHLTEMREVKQFGTRQIRQHDIWERQVEKLGEIFRDLSTWVINNHDNVDEVKKLLGQLLCKADSLKRKFDDEDQDDDFFTRRPSKSIRIEEVQAPSTQTSEPRVSEPSSSGKGKQVSEAGPSEATLAPIAESEEGKPSEVIFKEQILAYMYKDSTAEPSEDSDQLPEELNEDQKAFARLTQPRNRVWSEHRIEMIDRFREKVFRSVYKYIEYTVTRSNGEVSVFTDNDLINLNPYDLKELHPYFESKVDKGRLYRLAESNLKTAMGQIVLKHAKKDIQVALDCDQDKVDVEAPNEHLAELDIIRSGKLLSEPEMGMVYKGEFGVKRFFRIAEVHKYTDTTLQWFNLCIDEHGRGEDFLKSLFRRRIFETLEYRKLMRHLWGKFKRVF